MTTSHAAECVHDGGRAGARRPPDSYGRRLKPGPSRPLARPARAAAGAVGGGQRPAWLRANTSSSPSFSPAPRPPKEEGQIFLNLRNGKSQLYPRLCSLHLRLTGPAGLQPPRRTRLPRPGLPRRPRVSALCREAGEPAHRVIEREPPRSSAFTGHCQRLRFPPPGFN